MRGCHLSKSDGTALLAPDVVVRRRGPWAEKLVGNSGPSQTDELILSDPGGLPLGNARGGDAGLRLAAMAPAMA